MPKRPILRVAAMLAFVCGYSDGNALSRTGIFITGVSGNVCLMCVSIDSGKWVHAAFIFLVIVSAAAGTMYFHFLLTEPCVRKIIGRLGARLKLSEELLMLVMISVIASALLVASELCNSYVKLGYVRIEDDVDQPWFTCLFAFGVSGMNEVGATLAGVPAVQFVTGHTQTASKARAGWGCTLIAPDWDLIVLAEVNGYASFRRFSTAPASYPPTRHAGGRQSRRHRRLWP